MTASEGLRPYQRDAAEHAIRHLRDVRSTLIVMPTGTGKTQVFVSLAGRARGRVLLLAHRDELVAQAAERVRQMLGVEPEVEKAGDRASRTGTSGRGIVVGSVQTLRDQRLEEWPPDAFSLIVVDEAHHAVAQGYRDILHWFACAKVVGVTATPDRCDQKALGAVFDSVAYEYGLLDAIADGWLVEPIAERVVLEDVVLEDIPTTGGDFNAAKLETAIEKTRTLHSIAQPLMELSASRRTVVYTPGVGSAHGLAAILCEMREGCAHALDGTTPLDLRRQMLQDFNKDAYQYLVNCMVLTEGWDSPGVSCVAIARPTKSRALYAQMLGRGLRPSEGKTDCLVIDYVGTSRMDLCGPEDALGGSLGDSIVAEAKTYDTGDGPRSVVGHLRRAQATVVYRTKRERLIAERKQNPRGRKLVPMATAWILFGRDPADLDRASRWGLRPATETQIANLLRAGILPGDVSAEIARQMLVVVNERRKARLASPAQLRVLARYGKGSPSTSALVASGMIDRIAANGWRR